MSETWNFQRPYSESDALVYSMKHDGAIHRMVFDAPASICEHTIDSKKTHDKKGRSVLWDRPFVLVPEAFIGSEPPHMEMDTKVLLDEGIYLCYKGKHRQHLYQSVYLSAKNWSEKIDKVVYFWWHASTLYVTVMVKQSLQFANLFEVQNASVYFLLAAAQECDIHKDTFQLVGDSDSEGYSALEAELEKLQLTAHAVTREDLYPGYFQSPYQWISNYLYHLPQCALPEAY
jgi:hypothetical protein